MDRRQFRAIVVGQNALFREVLSWILNGSGFSVLASVGTAYDLRPASLHTEEKMLLIIDAGEDVQAAIDQMTYFREQRPDGRIALLAHRKQVKEVAAAFRAGANTCFTDVKTSDLFVKALELVMLGETILPSEVSSFIFEHPTIPESDNHGESMDSGAEPRLSPRQQAVLRCLIDGDSNKKIARRFGVAEATVKVHIKTILRKIQVRNRTQAAIWAMNNGLPVRGAVNLAAASLLPKLPALPLVTRGAGQRLPVDISDTPVAVVSDLTFGEIPDAMNGTDRLI